MCVPVVPFRGAKQISIPGLEGRQPGAIFVSQFILYSIYIWIFINQSDFSSRLYTLTLPEVGPKDQLTAHCPDLILYSLVLYS